MCLFYVMCALDMLLIKTTYLLTYLVSYLLTYGTICIAEAGIVL